MVNHGKSHKLPMFHSYVGVLEGTSTLSKSFIRRHPKTWSEQICCAQHVPFLVRLRSPPSPRAKEFWPNFFLGKWITCHHFVTMVPFCLGQNVRAEIPKTWRDQSVFPIQKCPELVKIVRFCPKNGGD